MTYDNPFAALSALLDRLEPVGVERVPWREAAGRVTAGAIVSDRDSPSCDVSAMDGYALRAADAAGGGARRITTAGEIRMGHAPPTLPAGHAMKITTGGPIPLGADAVVPIEHIIEHDGGGMIELASGAAVAVGQCIRRKGENLSAGRTVLEAGRLITPNVMSALVSFGVSNVEVRRRVRLGVIVTGDELLPPEAEVEPWQLRDSNGPVLRAMFGPLPWVQFVDAAHVPDRPGALEQALGGLLERCDAVFLTGGVSMGQHDYVPRVVRGSGAEVVFHKIPIRPGRPLLGAVGGGRAAIMGLPGNPVSVMATSRRFGAAALRRRAGFADASPTPPAVTLAEPDDRTLNLWWYRNVKLIEPGVAALVEAKGSGDIVSAARSDGVIEVPPGMSGKGPWAYYEWAVT